MRKKLQNKKPENYRFILGLFRGPGPPGWETIQALTHISALVFCSHYNETCTLNVTYFLAPLCMNVTVHLLLQQSHKVLHVDLGTTNVEKVM